MLETKFESVGMPINYLVPGLSRRRLCEVGSPQAHAQIRAKSTHPQKVDSYTGICNYTLVLKSTARHVKSVRGTRLFAQSEANVH